MNCSFLHIPSIGQKTERKIWENEIRTNEEFIKSPTNSIPPRTREKIINHINTSRSNMEDPHQYYDNLPSSEQWRIFKRFQKNTAYIDIETTGLDTYRDKITTIALYDGENIKHYVNGINLDEFKKDICDYNVIVTYNGKTFDVPFIESFFNIEISHCHLDLRYILKSLGYSGGLKSCEKQLGIGRGDDLDGVDGFMAVLIWNHYRRRKDKKALETLLAYNIEDVLNLEYLMITAYNKKIQGLPLELGGLEIPPKKDNPFEVDESIVNMYLPFSY
ncbi:ribonuclease H-like domain-containing protein [Desulfobacula sp.]|uniref:ribonuclease H-like domain-containing protein n=1 Tax=Desulfobacula sp. TaxID=2593537 RepID=UPI0025BD946F|nr:ribonuclease H-like domain-containing protein [Desulfobacula sp.]MBC2703521.1 ribonuclease H-like domain-containing protein [Desulfobacula sp.]